MSDEGEYGNEENGEMLAIIGEMGEGEEDYDPPPPPPPEEKELLFLIEFLVDTLNIKQENMNIEGIDPCALTGPAAVTLTFLHFPPMVLNEKDIDPDRVTGCDFVQFNAGKSLIFALTESQFENPPPVYLMVEATKQMPHAFRIPSIQIGKTKIQLSELFKQVFDKYDENPGKTVSKSIKDTYELMGEKKKTAGEVTLYVRLTCIGENVVTEFQKDECADDTVLFKNKESQKVYECKETEKPEENLCKTLPGWGDDGKGKECDGGDEQAPPPPPPPDPEDENFEEIFAEINGSVIRVKMEKGSRKEKPKEFHISDFCDCDIPLPQNLVGGMSDLSLGSNGSMNVGQGGGPVETDKRVGWDPANQLMFSLPPAQILTQQGAKNGIKYNVKTCVEGAVHGHEGQSSYKVITDNNFEGSVPQLPNDPEKDVFILRIIKRSKKNKEKETLELEFKTPKDKIKPPVRPPYMLEKAAGAEKSKKDKKKK